MPYIDENTLRGIEDDLQSAHKSFGHGDFSMPSSGAMAKVGLRAAEVVLPAAAFSYMNARQANGEVVLGPVAADLAVGLSLGLLSLFDMGGGYEDDMLNVGLGCLASYAARTGAAFGAASKLPPAPATTPTTTQGMTGFTAPEITGGGYGHGNDQVGAAGVNQYTVAKK